MFRRSRSRADFTEEIKAHLQLESDELKDQGWSGEEAKRRARISFGNVERAQERFYLKDRSEWLEDLWRDVKFAMRQLARNPEFASVVIIVLALGIGASTAMFAFVDAALLQPLPYARPRQLMSVNESSVQSSRWPLSYPDYVDWQRLNSSFGSLDVYSGTGFLLHAPGGTEPVQAERVSGTFFKTLGVHPVLGRDFLPGENRDGGPNVLLLSYGSWQDRFGGRRDLIGRTVDLDDAAYTIIGVLPRSFVFAPGGNVEFWVPLNHLSEHERTRSFFNFWGVGRLRDGVTRQAAAIQLNTISLQLQKEYGSPGGHLSASVVPLSEVIVGDVRSILLTLLAGACLLLAVACVNVGSLALVRSESRRREISVRGALGATRARLVRQFVTEGLLLAFFGDVAGMLLALGIIRLLTQLVPKDMAANMPFLGAAGVDRDTVLFALVVASLAALLLGAMPVLRLSLQEIRIGLSHGDRGASGALWRRLGANLVVVELAAAVVLLAGAGLLGRSLYHLLHVPLGFEADRLATIRVSIPDSSKDTNESESYKMIAQHISVLPGVQAAGMTNILPVQCDCSWDIVHFPDKPDQGESKKLEERHVSSGYMPALRASLIRGRFFTERDTNATPRVALINQSLAKTYFAGEDPLGKRIADDEDGRPAVWEIVGVVKDIHEGPLDVIDGPAEYFPINQTQDHSFTLVVRTSQDAGSILTTLVKALHVVDPNIGVSDESTMLGKIANTQSALLHRFSAWLVGGFAGVALVLGVVGLYGVVAYSVGQRTREIGVRVALGAQRGSLYRLVMQQAGWLTLAGLGIGLVSSVGTSLMMRNLLFQVQAWDVWTLVLVGLVLGLASLIATIIPARRAATVNPVQALRAE